MVSLTDHVATNGAGRLAARATRQEEERRESEAELACPEARVFIINRVEITIERAEREHTGSGLGVARYCWHTHTHARSLGELAHRVGTGTILHLGERSSSYAPALDMIDLSAGRTDIQQLDAPRSCLSATYLALSVAAPRAGAPSRVSPSLICRPPPGQSLSSWTSAAAAAKRCERDRIYSEAPE